MDFPQSDSDRGELLLGFARVGGAWLPDARGPSGLHFGRWWLVLQPWKETREQYGERLRRICQYVNANFEVEDLCRALPRRLNKLVENGGDRLRH